MNNSNLKRINVNLQQEQLLQLEEIQRQMHFTTLTAAIQNCISSTYLKLNPVHSPDARKKAIELRQRSLCSRLGGYVQDGLCHYEAYIYRDKKTVDKMQQVTELEQLTESILENQYQNAKRDKILSILAKKESE